MMILEEPVNEPAPEIDTFIYSEGVIITPKGKRIELTESHVVVLGRLMKKMTAGEYHAVSDAALAEVLWGPAACWPDGWKNDIRQTISDLRLRMRHGGVKAGITRHIGFGHRLTGRLGVRA